jgi:hypothetical protein
MAKIYLEVELEGATLPSTAHLTRLVNGEPAGCTTVTITGSPDQPAQAQVAAWLVGFQLSIAKCGPDDTQDGGWYAEVEPAEWLQPHAVQWDRAVCSCCLRFLPVATGQPAPDEVMFTVDPDAKVDGLTERRWVCGACLAAYAAAEAS